jgi:TIR domain
MVSSEPTLPDATSTKLKVFLSYSRKDAAFAQELLAALELLGFDAYLDKEDIAPGEPWEDRLGALIQMADTVVFIISPSSLASKHCTWEVEETARKAKRLVPVMLKQDPAIEVPERLRKLNYVFFSEGQSFTKGLSDLARALRANVGWIREHTRYGDLALRWIERRKPDALLLRGSDLDDARRWIAERPKDAPEISVNQQGFIDASGKAAAEELAAKARLRWRVQAGLAAVSVVLAGLAVFAGLQWKAAETAKLSLAASNQKLEATVGELKSAQSTLVTQNAQLETQKSQLETSNARLQRKLALRTAPFGNEHINVPAGWFQIATTFAGAVGFIERRTVPNEPQASGVIVNARRLDPRWSDRPVFLTTTYALSRRGRATELPLSPQDAIMATYGPGGERIAIRLGAVLWESAETGVVVASIEDRLPVGASVLDRIADHDDPAVPLAELTRSEINALFDAGGTFLKPGAQRPVIFVGYHHDRREVALSVSHLLGRLSAAEAGQPGIPNIPQTVRTSTPTAASPSLHADLVYLHVTMPGASGAPIFDAITGELIGIHHNGHLCPSATATLRRCWGGGTSMARVVAAIRAEPASR